MSLGSGSLISQSADPAFVVVNEYKAFTNFAFPIQEATHLAQWLEQGLRSEEITSKILVDNSFEMRSLKSRQGILRALEFLFEGVSQGYWQLLATGNAEVKRFCLLLMTLRVNRLLRDVVIECLSQQKLGLQNYIRRQDIKSFLLDKREQELDIQAWSDSTFQRVVSNTILILIRSELLKMSNKKDVYEINAMPIPRALRYQMEADHLTHYFPLLLN